MNELFRVYEWMQGRLTAGTALTGVVGSRIYRARAPYNATLPYVVYGYQGGHDVAGVGTARIMTDGVYVVRATGLASDYVNLKTAADALDTQLQGAAGTAGGATIAACVRESIFELSELDLGIEYAHVGGLYRISIYPT